MLPLLCALNFSTHEKANFHLLYFKISPLLDIKAWSQKVNHSNTKETLASITSHRWPLGMKMLTIQIMNKPCIISHEWLG
jgi:hypothetical protein